MPLTSMTKILPHAIANKYGVGAFNPVDYNSMKAIVAAAEASTERYHPPLCAQCADACTELV